MDLLRFAAIGSVDDGKSTLIGRLLFDTKSIFEDQMQAVIKASERHGNGEVNLALLTDGLRAEREQGITIDVAYRYTATPKRKFIIADCPGHIQYTRNMVTGCSSCNLAIILIDARHGVIEQTRRHSFLCSLLQIKHLILCVNKMDLVDFNPTVFEKIKEDFLSFASRLDIPDIRTIPISALAGDNVVTKSEKMPWYEGPTLLNTLEDVHTASDENFVDSRFPVQRVIRPHKAEFHDFRGYAGRVEGGVFKTGDKVTVMPSGFSSTIDKIFLGEKEITEAFSPMSVTMTLKDDIDVSRGDMISKPNNQPTELQDLDAMVCWLNKTPLAQGKKYTLLHTTREAKCMIKEIDYKIDINTLHKNTSDLAIGLNDIGRVKLRTTQPLFVDNYRKNKNTGSFILVDEFTNETVAAGLILN